ncbi:MAG: ribonuclease H-like domain-containing protein [Lachnospiraceae bacterium]|nr:ribonuclease H-like domain-containing protein [Lachnospiraceae bacterium]
MKTWQTTFTPAAGNPYIKEYFTPTSIFFDIETTGFSAARNQVYMIGYALQTDGKIRITQLFAECPDQEQEILSAFLELLPQYDTLISFNGTGFDVPFLKGRCAYHKIPEHLDSFRHLDIYKQLSRYKSILGLSNLKQKTLEEFLGIVREDLYSGGDLISIYSEYAKNAALSSQDACALLKLHNYEDMKGMIQLLPLLSYPRFFEGDFQVSSWETRSWNTYEGTKGWELILYVKPDLPFPEPFTCTLGKLYISASRNQAESCASGSRNQAESCASGSRNQAESCASGSRNQAESCTSASRNQAEPYASGLCRQVTLRIELFTGELRYFYPNYKDYYYLPAEDTALHKSVAAYVDRDYRTQATAATCYCKKSGRFLPQYQDLFSPAFKQNYKDKTSWFELTEAFTEKKENLKKYAMHLLKTEIL